MIDLQTVLDCVKIVVGTAGFLATVEHAAHEFVLLHFEADDGVNARATLGKHFLQGLSLVDCAGKAVKDDALLHEFGIGVENVLEHTDHEVVGNELSFRDVAVGDFAKLGAAGNVVAEDFACRDVMEAEMRNQTLALRAFAAAGSAENYEIEHCTYWRLDFMVSPL